MRGFSFTFIESAKDAIDAYEAHRTSSTGMRRWVRFCLALIGLFFIFGLGVALIKGLGPAHWWQVVIWFLIGSGLSWSMIVKPMVIRRRLRSSPARSVHVEVSEAGFAVRSEGEELHQRYWGELVRLLPARRGIGLGFRDGTLSWLPNRAFSNTAERAEFDAFVRSKVVPAEAKAV